MNWLGGETIKPFLRRPDFILSADASDSAQAAWLTHTPAGPCRYPIHHVFSYEERSLGSMRRELIGYKNCLIWLSKHFPLDGMCIQLIGDALSAVQVVAKGGSQQMDDDGNLPVLEVVLEMFQLMWQCNAVLLFHWRPREFLSGADSLSKVVERPIFL